MSDDESVKEVKLINLPESGALSRAWEAEASLRHRLLDPAHNCLTRWSKPTSVCQPSIANMKLNTRLLEVLAKIWVPSQEYPHAVPVDFLRKEASRSSV